MENHSCQKHTSRIISIAKKDGGFALVFLCFLLPVIFIGISFFYIGTIQIEMNSELNQFCRLELIKIQSNASQMLHSLMELNTHTQNQLYFKTKVEPKLSQLIGYENSPFLNINNLNSLNENSNINLMKSKRKLEAKLMDYKFKIKSILTLDDIKTEIHHYQSPSIDITRYGPNGTQVYIHLKENFMKLQSISLSWTYHLSLNPLFGKWSSWSQNFNGHCSTTLSKEKPWRPILYEDRSFWRRS